MSGRHYSALGYLAANEATSNDGTSLTRGAEALAREDAERKAYLDSLLDDWKTISRSQRRKMGAKERKRIPEPA